MSSEIESIREVYLKWKNSQDLMRDYDDPNLQPIIDEVVEDIRDAVKEDLGIDLEY